MHICTSFRDSPSTWSGDQTRGGSGGSSMCVPGCPRNCLSSPPHLLSLTQPSMAATRTSRVMVFPVSVFTKICMATADPPVTGESRSLLYTDYTPSRPPPGPGTPAITPQSPEPIRHTHLLLMADPGERASFRPLRGFPSRATRAVGGASCPRRRLSKISHVIRSGGPV